MSDNPNSGATPKGRMLSGAIFTPTNRGYQGKILDPPEFFIQIAILKTDPGMSTLFVHMQAAAAAGFSNNEPARTDFAWKYRDGDKPEFVNREGYRGCYVFIFKTGAVYPPQLYDPAYNQLIDPTSIKPGYHIRVSYSMKANGDTAKPGIYLNFHMVLLVAVDKEIVSGPPPSEVFGPPSAGQTQAPGMAPAPGIITPGVQSAPGTVPAPGMAPGQNAPGTVPAPGMAPAPDPSFLVPPGPPVDDIPF